MCQQLLDKDILSERHVLLQGFEAFVGVLGGGYDPHRIPWWTQGSGEWTIASAPLNNLASFEASMYHHSTRKASVLSRGKSFADALGDPRLINSIKPSLDTLDLHAPPLLLRATMSELAQS